MKLTVFGATGDVGKEVVTQALVQGHQVCAFSRKPEKLQLTHQNLELMKGDVLDPSGVSRAIQGQDAVICTLGMPILNKDYLRAEGTRNILQAMEEQRVRRFVCLSVHGARSSRKTLPFHYKYFIIPVLLGRVVKDHEMQQRYIQKSQLDWVVVRPVNFTKGPHTESYKQDFTAFGEPATFKISYADVADFMLKQLVGNKYLHQFPSLSY